ncbi:hypothetical protein [Hufsiella ginkgonis]|uniref:Uncharacterized protein n=1 Tax=Hufsiella ginkgonis TaxID=2695274 RepID=A0A7K1Y018_9SPHI|nr:hypothetical protein [Hufsiella ginkgonis]MXV16532.1 hypothetical protein [Hufsiella ginkgonis]
MISYQIDILNPKATKLLQDLADLQLIAIKKPSDDGFLNVVKRLRTKAAANPPSLEDITAEVELVRARRYAGK